jgi:hypothetical protein
MAMVFPTSPTVGQVFTSGSRSWVWNGSAWDSPSAINVPLSGLVPLVNQNVSASTGFAVDNVFSSLYQNYKVMLKVDSMSAGNSINVNFQYRKAGSTVTASNYRGASFFLGIDSNVTAFWFRGNGVSAIALGNAGVPSTPSYYSLEILSPNIATTTTGLHMQASIRYNGTSPSNSSNMALFGSTDYTANDNFDGFIITPGSGNFSGNIKVYGYRDQ